LLLASSVMLSRVLGYVREMILAWRSGASAETDAFYAAFQIPDLLNHFLAGGALSIAFVPLYHRLREREGEAGADRLVEEVLGTLGVLAIAATAVLFWHADSLVSLQFPRFASETQALTTHLTRIVLPAQIFFLIGGIANAVLLARESFLAAAVAPLVYNAGIIAGGLVLAPWIGIEGFAWGALAGSIAGPFLAPILLGRGTIALRPRFAPFGPHFRSYFVLAMPLLLGQTLLTVDEWYLRWFGALLGEGTVARLSYARRLMLVPVAVVGQALAAAALPTLSRLYAEGRHAELARTLLATLRTGLGLALLTAGACVALAGPLVTLTFERGAFGPADSAAVALLLAILSASVPAWVVQQIAVRDFYARRDTWRPMLLGTVVALAAIPLYLALGRSWGASGLAFASAFAMTANALATLALARRLHGGPSLRLLGASAVRGLALASLAAGAAFGARAAWGVIGSADAAVDAFANLAVGSLAFAIVTALALPWLGDEPLRAGLGRLSARILRRRAAP
jgi:putative peptidoglycan lipid II flippase